MEAEIGYCGCPDNESLIVGEHCDACEQEVVSGEVIDFLTKFYEALDDEGVSFFTSGEAKKDLNTVKAVIEAQGYWAGNRTRVFFDKKLFAKGIVKVTKTEERKFGA